MSDLPPFPKDFNALPPRFQKKLGRMVIDKQQAIQEGIGGMLKWAYVGSIRPDGTEVSWAVSPRDCWALLNADVEAEGNANRSGT